MSRLLFDLVVAVVYIHTLDAVPCSLHVQMLILVECRQLNFVMLQFPYL